MNDLSTTSDERIRRRERRPGRVSFMTSLSLEGAGAVLCGKSPSRTRMYGYPVMVQRHWWNGSKTTRSRRDVYIRSDGRRWDVLVQIGGTAGRYRVQDCPSSSSAVIVAGAWRGSGAGWQELAPRPAAEGW